MSRVINIDELWKELEILYDAKNGEVAWNDALWKIKSAPVVESNAQQWIPCSERLPEDGEKVIVQAQDMYYNMGEDTGVVIGYRHGQHWETFTAKGCELIRYPAAWMPRPESWNGEKWNRKIKSKKESKVWRICNAYMTRHMTAQEAMTRIIDIMKEKNFGKK